MPNAIDTQSANNDDFVGSHLKSKNGLGQNGYTGASSLTPGKTANMDRAYGLKTDPDLGGVTGKFGETGNWQTRSVSKEAYPTTFGMSAKGEPAKVPDANIRRATKSVNPKSFQR